MAYRTEQEEFWSGQFGDAYIERNQNHQIVAANTALFAEALKLTEHVETVAEFGSNIGLNLRAIHTLLPKASLEAVEINHKAVEILRKDSFFEVPVKVHETSILEFEPAAQYDFVLIKGVLIHINPNELEHVYEKLYQSSRRYILLCEYYNPTPAAIEYRGHKERLFKRDFAGEFLKKYQDVKLLSYGFRYHLDSNFPMDDITWFLMEKKQ